MSFSYNPYLTFDDCREAMGFYGKVFGAEPEFTPLSDMPGYDDSDKVMHSELRAKEITLMGSDNIMGGQLQHGNVNTIALMAGKEDEARAREIFQALADGGTVTMPLELQPWGDLYGQLTDRFGFEWAMNVGQA